jgi:uncharacterized protein YndB with AHSA1/START domain
VEGNPADSSSLEHSVSVELPLEAAFARFVDDLNEWWPREYTWSGDALEQIGIELKEGGMCFERGPDGFRVDWGRVTELDPPTRLAFTWQVGPHREPVPDESRASEVEVTFVSDDEGRTRVSLEHRGFERHGDEGGGYCAAMASDQGWPYILGRYALTNG